MKTGPRSLLFALPIVLGWSACTTPETGSHLGPMSEGTLTQNTATIGASRSSPEPEMAGDPEGVARIGGQMFYVKDRGTTLLTPGRVTEGLTLERNGQVMLPDGRRMKVLEGWMITRGGELREAPPWLTRR
ncbi:MAG TPA: hypothetical protein VF614_14410 [Chthoniobacteraceae bacterium]